MFPLIDKIDKWKVLFHFEFLISAYFLLSRPLILGIDSYAFFLKSCGLFNFKPQWLPDVFFNLLPCSQLLFNLSAIFFFYLFIIFLSKFISIYYPKEKVWKVMMLMWLVPTITNFFYQFENSSIGLTAIMLFFWFYFKAKHEGVKDKTLLVLLLMSIGLHVWQWALIPLFALSFENLLALAVFIIVTLYLSPLTVFGSLFPFFDVHNSLVIENQPGIGVFALFPILIGMFNFRKEFKLIAIVFTGLALLAAKFSYFALPFLMIGAFDFFSRFESRWKDYPWINYILFKNILIIGIFLFIVPFTLFGTIYNQIPSLDDFSLISHGIQIAQDINLPFKNEWGIGHWVLYLGGKTDRYGGWTPNNTDFNHSIAITITQKLDCGIIEEGKPPMNLITYFCP